jgi:hypothetical protein
MEIYQDDIITFELPHSLTKKSVKKDIVSWGAISNKIDFSIFIDFGDDMYYHSNIKILPKEGYEFAVQGAASRSAYYYEGHHKETTKGISGLIVYYEGPYKRIIEGKKVCYSFFISEVRGHVGLFAPTCRIAIYHDRYVLYVEIGIERTSDCSFPLEDYMPFITSIKVLDFDKLKNRYDNIVQKNVKKYSKPIEKLPTVIPHGFIEIKSITPDGRSMKKDGFEIHIFDFTGLGREADIDIFKENLKEDEKIEGACLWEQLSGKRCLVQNTDGTSLNVSSCKDISVLLAFRGKCYSVSMKSDNPFDLNEYKSFLDSIGIKTKKSPKNKQQV